VTNSSYTTDLTDDQWQIIKDLLPPPKRGGRPRTVCLRQSLNAMFYLLTTGCQWSLIPKSYPHFRTVYGYFPSTATSALFKMTAPGAASTTDCAAPRGVWRDGASGGTARLAGRRTRPTAASVDSQCVKATPVAGVRGYDAFKRIKGRKRHIIVDTLGLLLAVVVTPANISNTAGAVQLLPLLGHSAHHLRRVWCDGGYFNAALEQAKACGLKLEPVLRPAGQKGFAPLPKRWVVERTFAWLSRCRRLAREYEVRIESSEAFVCLAMTRLMIVRLAPA